MMELKEKIKIFLDFFFSPVLTLILIGGGALYYLLVVVLTGRETLTVTAEIAIWESSGGDIPGLVYQSLIAKLFFLLLITNFIGRSIKTYLASQRRVEEKEFMTGENILSYPNHQVYSCESKPSELAKKITFLLKELGYQVFQEKKDNFWHGKAVKNQLQLKLVFIFKLSLIFIFTGVLLSFAFRRGGQIFLGEGEAVFGRKSSLEWSNYTWAPMRDKGNLYFPFDYLGVISVDPALQAGYLPQKGWLIFKHLVRAQIEVGLENQARQLFLSFYPPTHFKGYFLFLSRFGYGPLISVRNQEGKELYHRYQKVYIFPPGSEDIIQIPFLEEKILLSLANPEKGKKYLPQPRQPVYLLKIVKEKKVLLERLVYPGDFVEYKGHFISIPETLFWVGVVILKDWGLYLSFFGLILSLASVIALIIVRLFFPFHQVYISLENFRGHCYLFMHVKPTSLHRLGRRIFKQLSKLV